MQFEGEFKVPGRPDDVIIRFTDVERMARCLPGASLEGRDEEGAYIGVMTVAFGPKRIKFKGKMSCDFDLAARTGTLKGRGAADLRAARVSVQTAFSVRADPEADPSAPVSIVKINSESELGGVIADFAKTGGIALANVLLAEFAKNLAEEFAKEEASAQPNEVKALSAHKVLWSAVKSKLTS